MLIISITVVFSLLLLNYSMKSSSEIYSWRIYKDSSFIKKYYQKVLSETPIDKILPNVSIWIIHQYPYENDKYGKKYRTNNFMFSKDIDGSAKEFYFIESNETFYKPIPEKTYLGYRYDRQNYLLEITPAQQREIVKKLIELEYFELDDMMDINVLGRARRGMINALDLNLFDKEFYAIQADRLVYTDTTSKNKAVIMEYKNWIDSKYKTELLKHPVDKWPED